MQRIGLLLVVSLILLGPEWIARAQSKPAKNAGKLNLTRARRVPASEDPEKVMLDVRFGDVFPKEYSDAKMRDSNKPFELRPDQRNVAEGNPKNWLVETKATERDDVSNENVGARDSFEPVGLFVDPKQKIVYLLVDPAKKAKINPSTHKVAITYKQENYPDVVVGEPERAGADKIYGPAKGKDDSDIYFSGKAIGANKSKPVYSFESKIGYSKDLGLAGAIGAKATMDAEQGSDADPDSITASASYEKIFLFPPPSTNITFQWDMIGGEFDRKNQTRNIVTAPQAKLVIPSAQFGKNYVGTIDFLAGFEAGNNYKNKLRPEGIGGFFRWKFGAGAYLTALDPPVFKKVHLSANWQVRLPLQPEIFTEKVRGIKDPVSSLTRRPRHHVGIDTDFMFSKAFGLTMQYRWGSLPPAFNLVDRKVSAGLVVKLAQTSK